MRLRLAFLLFPAQDGFRWSGGRCGCELCLTGVVLGQRLPLPAGSYPVKFLQVRSLLVDIRQQVLYLAGDLDIAEGITFRGRRQVGIPKCAEYGPSRGRFCFTADFWVCGYRVLLCR